jgi:hypothetical protein
MATLFCILFIVALMWSLVELIIVKELCKQLDKSDQLNELIGSRLSEALAETPTSYAQEIKGDTYAVYAVFSQYGNIRTCVRTFDTEDVTYNKICAEELLDKLNEQL